MEEAIKQAITECYPLAELFHKAKSLRINAQQLNKLAAIESGLFGRTLNKSCSGCIKSALGRLYQYQSQRIQVMKQAQTIKPKGQDKQEQKQQINFSAMKYNELQAMAKAKGYDLSKGKKKADLIKYLQSK